MIIKEKKIGPGEIRESGRWVRQGLQSKRPATYHPVRPAAGSGTAGYRPTVGRPLDSAPFPHHLKDQNYWRLKTKEREREEKKNIWPSRLVFYIFGHTGDVIIAIAVTAGVAILLTD